MEAKNRHFPWTPESQRTYMRGKIERAWAGNRSTLRAFADWLVARGLSPGTVTGRIALACFFVDTITSDARTTCVKAFQSLTADGIEDFFVQYGKNHGIATRRSMSTAMRSFLKFAASQGWGGLELSGAVPSLQRYQLSNLPRSLNDRQLSMLLGSPWGSSRCARRDKAIVYLLATYGVRREQVSTLQFADIDWIERTIDFAAHKRGKKVHHTLTQTVAEFLADYLRDERPISDSNYIFLRQRRPYLRLSPNAITVLVRERMVRCGLSARGPHALRHSFATRLLQAGQSVKTIADLLGHRSLSAIGIYAKVDYARLIEVAVDWPEVEP
jgi:integrase/recombinase XerD